jgi:hypothetical protein
MREFKFTEEERVALVWAAQSTKTNLDESGQDPDKALESALKKLRAVQERKQ